MHPSTPDRNPTISVQGYGYPSQYGPGSAQPPLPPSQSGDQVCTAAMWLGIAGLAFPLLFMLWSSTTSNDGASVGLLRAAVSTGGPLFSLLAVIFGGMGLSRVRRGLATRKGAATAGLTLGIIGLSIVTLFLLFVVGLILVFVAS